MEKATTTTQTHTNMHKIILNIPNTKHVLYANDGVPNVQLAWKQNTTSIYIL